MLTNLIGQMLDVFQSMTMSCLADIHVHNKLYWTILIDVSEYDDVMSSRYPCWPEHSCAWPHFVFQQCIWRWGKSPQVRITLYTRLVNIEKGNPVYIGSYFRLLWSIFIAFWVQTFICANLTDSSCLHLHNSFMQNISDMFFKRF